MRNVLTGHGAPTIKTVGKVGQRYTDLDTGDIYTCVGYSTRTLDNYESTKPHEFVKFNTPTGHVRKYTWQLVPDNANNFAEVNEKFNNFGGGGGSGGGDIVISNEDAFVSRGINEPWIANKEVYEKCVNAYNSKTPFIPNITLLFFSDPDIGVCNPYYMWCSADEIYPYVILFSRSPGYELRYHVFPDQDTLEAYWQYEMS